MNASEERALEHSIADASVPVTMVKPSLGVAVVAVSGERGHHLLYFNPCNITLIKIFYRSATRGRASECAVL